MDHLVRLTQQRLRDSEAQGQGGLTVDQQVIPRGLLERQLARLRALEDLVDVRCRTPKIVDRVRSVAHQAPGLGVFAELTYRRQPMLERLGRNYTRLLQEEPSGQNVGGIAAFFRNNGEFALDFRYCACLC